MLLQIQNLTIYISLFLGLLIFGNSFRSYAQEVPDSVEKEDAPLIKNIPLVTDERPADTTFVEMLPNLWSLRIYAVGKNQGNFIKSNETKESVRYRPNNRFGIGLGFTYKFLLVDVGFNLTGGTENVTKRFDFQGALFGRNYVVDMLLQVYEGYELTQTQPQEDDFREDLHIWHLGINYMQGLSKGKLSIRSAFSGSEIQKESTGSFVVGGFFSTYHLDADSSIIPPERSGMFNEYAQIDRIDLSNFGVSVGYAYSLVLPKNFFFFGAVLPGIGLNFGEISALQEYSPPVVPFGKVNFRISVGRSTHKSYQMLTYSADYFFSDLGHQNLLGYNIAKLKFVYGFRFLNKKNPLRKIL